MVVVATAAASPQAENGLQAVVSPPPLVLGLQPCALVDHVARVDLSLLDSVPGEEGGSMQVTIKELERIMSQVSGHVQPSNLKTIARGSVANTIRGLAANFGVTCGIIGACGDDQQGQLFLRNLRSGKVNISGLKTKTGVTAQCISLVDAAGNHTMRPCFSNAVKLEADDLTRESFKGSMWLVLRYAVQNLNLIQTAVRIAKLEGLFVSLDLASFQMVRNFKAPLKELLESGNIDLCFANEDEATEVVRGEMNPKPEAALEYLARHCKWAVVTLGSNGCIARHGQMVVRSMATGEAKACDATGAGDLFASGFLYGLTQGLSLEECCKVGACSGGSVIRSLGAEVTPDNRHWLCKQMEAKGLPIPNALINV